MNAAYPSYPRAEYLFKQATAALDPHGTGWTLHQLRHSALQHLAGDDPAVVAKVVVTAATDKKPKLRYTAGPLAVRMRTLRRFAPAITFDKGVRKFNRMPA